MERKAMKKISFVVSALLAGSLLMAATGRGNAKEGAAPNAAAAGTPVHMLVTVEARRGTDVPDVGRVDVMVHEGRDRDQVTDWVPAQGANGGLELFILLDDGSSFRLGSQLEEIHRFIDAQPGFAKIGVAYMQNGIAKVQQELTTDHAAAGKALRLPMGMGGINGNPYICLSDLIKRWPQSNARREVLMVTDGIDRYYGGGTLEDPYLDAAISDAQRAGIVVYGIYMPGSGRSGRRRGGNNWGQIHLSQLTEET